MIVGCIDNCISGERYIMNLFWKKYGFEDKVDKNCGGQS